MTAKTKNTEIKDLALVGSALGNIFQLINSAKKVEDIHILKNEINKIKTDKETIELVLSIWKTNYDKVRKESTLLSDQVETLKNKIIEQQRIIHSYEQKEKNKRSKK